QPTLYPLSLHDALPISRICCGSAMTSLLRPLPCAEIRLRENPPAQRHSGIFPQVAARSSRASSVPRPVCANTPLAAEPGRKATRSEEHTSELQSPCNLV